MQIHALVIPSFFWKGGGGVLLSPLCFPSGWKNCCVFVCLVEGWWWWWWWDDDDRFFMSVMAGGVARNTTVRFQMEKRSQRINCVRSCEAFCWGSYPEAFPSSPNKWWVHGEIWGRFNAWDSARFCCAQVRPPTLLPWETTDNINEPLCSYSWIMEMKVNGLGHIIGYTLSASTFTEWFYSLWNNEMQIIPF